MAVKIRLSRVGTKGRPYYRIVAADGRKQRDGEILANVGTYDPMNHTIIQFHEDIYQTWLSKGAIPTDSTKKVYRLYKKSSPTTSSVKPESAATVEQAAQ